MCKSTVFRTKTHNNDGTFVLFSLFCAIFVLTNDTNGNATPLPENKRNNQ